jgi:NADH dehydrogenase/putative oxidoreductase
MPKWSRYAPAVEAVNGIFGFVDCRLAPLFDLFIRLWLASIFFTSGMLKLDGWWATVQLYTSEHPIPGLSPQLAAIIGTGIELICPILLVAGLMTRLAAIPLLLTTAFLQLTYKDLNIHLYWMMLLGYLVVRGAGAISLDHFIGPHLHKVPLPFARAAAALADALSTYAWPVFALALRLWMAKLFFDSVRSVAIQ